VVVFFLAIIAIGAAQGYVGAKLWKGRIYMMIDGEKLPGVLGVGSASLAGAVGALILVGVTVGFLVVSTLLIEYFFPKERDPHGRIRSPDPGQLELAETEQQQR
jgi:hypothetical protein